MKNFNTKVQARFAEMAATGKLFRVNITGQQVWDKYLESFQDGDDPVFRDPESSTHNCNFCNNFIRRYGNIVALDAEYKIMSLFDFDIEGEFKNVAKELSTLIKSGQISEVFFETYAELNGLPYEKCNKRQDTYRLGIDTNTKRYTREEAAAYNEGKDESEWPVKPNQVVKFDHVHLDLPKAFVSMAALSVASINAKYVSACEVFQRTMEDIPLATLTLVRDLINQNSILDGEADLPKVEALITMKTAYEQTSIDDRDNWCWVTSHGFKFAKVKNDLIGVLLTDLAEGMNLMDACKLWNKRKDPVNYMRAVAPFTETQKKNAAKKIKELGVEESFVRRLATIDDIKASEILHINSGKGEIAEVSILDSIKAPSHQHKKNEFKNVEEVSIEKFMSDILPGCTSVEAYLTNKHKGNMVNMTTTKDDADKPIFKWGNSYSYTFNGNLAGKSMIKEAVKSEGGAVDGVLRFSIMWAEGNDDDSDLDAHAQERNSRGSNTIMYSRKSSSLTQGKLDIDIRHPRSHKANRHGAKVVENITYPSIERLKGSTIKFLVHQFSGRGSKGFKAEIEFDGQLFTYEQVGAVRGMNPVATVECDANGEFTIKHHREVTEGETASVELYGLQTNQFHKVNLACLSPNHWGENSTGNKYYMFMLDGCKAPGPVRTFHSENLIPELHDIRGVLDVLGDTVTVPSTEKQLAGLGFNATVHDELIVKLSGSHKRTVKIKF